MNSITKAKISELQIHELIKFAFGSSVSAASITELSDGMYNTALKITLSDNLNTVLKVSPPQDTKVLRYEKNIMETEVSVLNQIRACTSVPVPKVYYFDHKHSVVDSDYFFMEYIEGVPLNKLHDKLRDEQVKTISGSLGTFTAQMQAIHSDYFGYISQKDKRFPCWADAFVSMIRELLDDAADINEELPIRGAELLAMIEECYAILNLVKTPSFIHKDLWEGNVFVDAATTQITGIVDFERALYGDTLLEPVCGFLLENDEFMSNSLGKTQLSYEEKTRTVLYSIYLYLIMFVECGFRQYTDDRTKAWAGKRLEQSIQELKRKLRTTNSKVE